MDKIKIVFLIFLGVWILVGDLEITVTRKNIETKFKYNGIVWVILDYWSIWKYSSNDTPMKTIELTKTEIK